MENWTILRANFDTLHKDKSVHAEDLCKKQAFLCKMQCILNKPTLAITFS